MLRYSLHELCTMFTHLLPGRALSQLGTIDAANLLRFPRYSDTHCVCTRHPFQSLLPKKGSQNLSNVSSIVFHDHFRR